LIEPSATERTLVAALAVIGLGAVFQLAPRRARAPLILTFSAIAYLIWDPYHAPLLAVVALAGRALGLRIAGAATEARKAAWLAAGVIAVVALIVYFRLASLAYPLGLSYFSFRALAYLIEVYWDRLPARRDLVPFASYLAFFPHLVSGPIQRPDDYLEQLEKPSQPASRLVLEGVVLALWGCCKKAIADRLAGPVGEVFIAPASFTGVPLAIASHLFLLQLYLDFSGLTDVALGVGRCFGIAGPPNFTAPFFARNVQEFWKSWHVSLTSWLRDYVFTPLAMAARNFENAGVVVAIFANMTLMGLWHGFTWNYLVFGLVHAALMSALVLTAGPRRRFKKLPGAGLIARLVTLELVVASFVLFRATSLGDAWWVISRAFVSGATAWPAFVPHLIAIAVGVALVSHLVERGTLAVPRSELACYGLVALAFAFLYGVVDAGRPISFIYQQF
jgi:alginate O-acetyltransferase complex protein AlgI